jgi:ArsR family transcriptional regulator
MEKWENKANQERAIIFKALGHPLRLAILDELQKGECCVQDLMEKLGCEQSNLSRHLAVLKQTGIIDCRKDGLYVYYSLAIPCISGIFKCINQVLSKRIETNQEISEQL